MEIGIPVVTSGEMEEIDRLAVEEFHIPAVLLMNNAGRALAHKAIEEFHPGSVTIFCGTGNNGGDGFAAAWYLHGEHVHVNLVFHGPEEKLSGESRTFYDIVKKLDISIVSHPEKDPESDVIIDAMLGTGVTGKVKEPYSRWIDIINRSSSPVISADIPSGLPAQGEVHEVVCVEADITVTMGLPKISMVTWPGKKYSGEVEVADIGFPDNLLISKNNTLLLDEKQIESFLPAIPQNAHKGTRGRVLVIGGFTTMEGAGLLAAQGALASGAGLVHLYTEEKAREIVAGRIPEIITHGFTRGGNWNHELDTLLNEQQFHAIVLGPGLGREESAEKIVAHVINLSRERNIPLVLDGDGLYHLAQMDETILGNETVITPHEGEAAGILKIDSGMITSDRYRSARKLYEETGAVSLLKGASTIIAWENGTFINPTGNQALAFGGSGDILAGYIGGMLAQKVSSEEAAALGAWFHGRAADRFLEEHGRIVMKASEVIQYLYIL